MTMPGILAGNCRTTSRMASVPPVDAPIAIKLTLEDGFAMEDNLCTGAVFCEKVRGTVVGIGVGASWEGRRTCALEPTASFVFSVAKNASFPPSFSIPGLRTKSIAPAANASNTLILREETRTTGTGWIGRTSFKNSSPLMPGISISIVMISGLRSGSLFLASRAFTAYPTTSNQRRDFVPASSETGWNRQPPSDGFSEP